MPDEIELYDDLPYGDLTMEVVGTESQLKVWTREISLEGETRWEHTSEHGGLARLCLTCGR